MSFSISEQNYTLGRGRLFFERFAPGVTIARGLYRYIGSTPTITMTLQNEVLDHFNSESGLRVKDRTTMLQQDLGGTFVTTNIDDENMALLLAGNRGTESMTALTGQSQTFTGITLGTHQQIGVTAAKPEGIGNINVLTATRVSPSTPLVAGTDYDLDAKNGMLYWRPNANALTNGNDVTITYSTSVGQRTRILNAGLEIYGSMKYVADNQEGLNRDKVWPYVKLMPTGDFALKGDEWQQITFQFEVLRRADGAARAIDLTRYV